MIIIYHNNKKGLETTLEGKALSFSSNNISKTLLEIAKNYPEELLIWCHIDLKSNLNTAKLASIFHHNKIMASYNLGELSFLGLGIGYVEESPFIKINKTVSYPTWQMSSFVGGIHASVLNLMGSKVIKNTNFDYFLNSVAKIGMAAGLFCYSEPQLLLTNNLEKNPPASNKYILFRFVKQHYKKRWLVLLWLNLLVFEKQILVLPLLYALFYSSRKRKNWNLDAIQVKSAFPNKDKKTMDVIIPTIGRKQYLYDVLQDLTKQTHLPQKVIVVEQNPKEGSVSELDYLENNKWPFEIKHIFTHQAGACNARNLALAEVTSEWVFLNDDDNRFDENLIQNVFDKAVHFGIQIIITAYLQPNETQRYNTIHQSGIFGSGNSFAKTTALNGVRFDKALEYGYGEDTDFGLQLRNKGQDIMYFHDLRIIHLKAPTGGFRTKIKKQWDTEAIQPKPSPTILYVLQKHYTLEQLKSYKLVLFLKLLKYESLTNYFNFYKNFKQKWSKSMYWANQLRR